LEVDEVQAILREVGWDVETNKGSLTCPLAKLSFLV
jgi:hypothetical protein